MYISQNWCLKKSVYLYIIRYNSDSGSSHHPEKRIYRGHVRCKEIFRLRTFGNPRIICFVSHQAFFDFSKIFKNLSYYSI